MFTGIIEGLGTIRHVRSVGSGKRLTVAADFTLDGTKTGDSIAVNGACLTAVSIDGSRFEADVSPESLSATTLGRTTVGDRVNIERALRLSDRLDGHLVTGHVDGMGTLKRIQNEGNAIRMTFSAPESLTRYMVKKGSVAVDGISLTINRCDSEQFEVSIIPHTAKITTLGLRRAGDAMNIETDIIGKYVERFASAGSGGDRGGKKRPSSIDTDLLYRTGFL